jgi:hypothetical protein
MAIGTEKELMNPPLVNTLLKLNNSGYIMNNLYYQCIFKIMMYLRCFRKIELITLFLLIPFHMSYGEPIVIKGHSVKKLLGSPISTIRIYNQEKKP